MGLGNRFPKISHFLHSISRKITKMFIFSRNLAKKKFARIVPKYNRKFFFWFLVNSAFLLISGKITYCGGDIGWSNTGCYYYDFDLGNQFKNNIYSRKQKLGNSPNTQILII